MALSFCFTCQLFYSKPWILNWDWWCHTWPRAAKGQVRVAECWLQKMWWVHRSPKHRQAAAAAWLHCRRDSGGESGCLGHSRRVVLLGMKKRQQRGVGGKGSCFSPCQPCAACESSHLLNEERAFSQILSIPSSFCAVGGESMAICSFSHRGLLLAQRHT